MLAGTKQRRHSQTEAPSQYNRPWQGSEIAHHPERRLRCAFHPRPVSPSAPRCCRPASIARRPPFAKIPDSCPWRWCRSCLALQQISEGFVWLGLHEVNAALVERIIGYLLVLRDRVLAVLDSAESGDCRIAPCGNRLGLALLAIVGLAWLWLYFPLAVDPARWLTTEVVGVFDPLQRGRIARLCAGTAARLAVRLPADHRACRWPSAGLTRAGAAGRT